MKIKIENTYEDGHQSEEIRTVQDLVFVDLSLEEQAEEMWDYLYEFTGDGHGDGEDMGSFYEITVLEAVDPRWVGQVFEWCSG